MIACQEQIKNKPYSGNRRIVHITNSWKFYQGDIADAALPEFEDADWETLNLPHTWNRVDGEDGGNDYYRGIGWYRKRFQLDADIGGRRVYIEFQGVNSQMTLFLNGKRVGVHKGGYTAFRFDITAFLRAGENYMAVRVCNAHDNTIAPLSGDFTFFGGIYRDVSLIYVDPLHFDLNDFGSSGVYLTAEAVSAESAVLRISARVVNQSNAVKRARLCVYLRRPDGFTQTPLEAKYLSSDLRFQKDALYREGGIAASKELDFTVEPGTDAAVLETSIEIARPHLWDGLRDPYRYQVEIFVLEDGKVADCVEEFMGFRYFSVDKDRGFFLNGRPYPLRGVAMHQDYEGKGNAVTSAEITESFSRLYEIGANTVRLSHYPHNRYTYELCDKYGVIVYAEIPFVNTFGGSGSFEDPDPELSGFMATTKQQLTELIKQQYNRCAIVFWGLYNEAQKASHAVMVPLVAELNTLAHRLDPARLTVTATFSEEGEALQSDLLAWNTYPAPGCLKEKAENFYHAMGGGKISKKPERYGRFYIAKYDAAGFYDGVLSRPAGISEYGVGGSVAQHTDIYWEGSDTIKMQTEEFQAYCHETWAEQIRSLQYLWGTYIWNLFDFSADNRDEATVPGVNTKGLVSRDRQTRKDAFYLYKAFWRTDAAVLYITGKNNKIRHTQPRYFKVYSNCDSAALSVDGKILSTIRQEENACSCVFLWNFTGDLAYGEHRIRVIGMKGGNTAATDELILTLAEQNDADVQPDASESERSIRFHIGVPAEQPGHPKENLTDGKAATRWAGEAAAVPAVITIDFGEPAHLSEIEISWYEARAYRYQILTSEDGEFYHAAADLKKNELRGNVRSHFTPVLAKYVKIAVTGTSDCSNWISAYSVKADAWRFHSCYEIDETRHTVWVPYDPRIVISKEEFIAALGLEGDCTAAVSTGGDATVYYITDRAELVVKALRETYRYTILYGQEGAD